MGLLLDWLCEDGPFWVVYSVFGYQLGAAKFHRDFMDAGALVEEAPPVLEKQGPIVWDDAQHVAVENEESQVVGESFLFHSCS